MNLTPHHVGCAAKDMATGLSLYSDTLGLARRTRPLDIPSQNVTVCFLELGGGVYLELVAPLSSDNLAGYLKVGFYHLCFLVQDLEATRARLVAQQFAPLPAFASPAFAGNACQFFVSPQRHLIELAQMSRADFEQYFASNAA